MNNIIENYDAMQNENDDVMRNVERDDVMRNEPVDEFAEQRDRREGELNGGGVEPQNEPLLPHVNYEPRYNLRNRQNLNPPDRGDTINNFMFDSEEIEDILIHACDDVPSNYAEAVQSELSEEWKNAMRDEILALKKNDTWIMAKPPPNVKILTNRWVYKIKNDPITNQEKYRARLVIKGFLQRKDIDYEDVFSPVARYNSIRAFLVISAAHNLKLRQFDVKFAFLNGDLTENIYMKQPEGFDDRSGMVCHLQKSLYGLKHSARCWNKSLLIV
ncbi:unnamed protein product [Trichogramma brassicae]|uniref:Reverse transcriptase Ty1/copia-type domain-containing protein n=1 Tax=Trichogramma brassicae TaxID=86971 RepID=A0A6H5JCC4_9HYME|nr:unnamed protein product [Trichogramma brassicae]